MFGWLRALIIQYHDRPDPAWRPTRLKFTTARHYDQKLAIAASRRSRRRSATGKAYPKPSAPKPAEIVPMRRAK